MALSDRMADKRLADAGYVEKSPSGPRCGNCAYADKASSWCKKWKTQVDMQVGCCDAWEDEDAGTDE